MDRYFRFVGGIMKNKHLYLIGFFIAFFLGVGGTILLLDNTTIGREKIIEQTLKTVSVTEADSLKSAIELIDDAVVYIETTTKTGNASGSGFVYKTDDNYGYILTNCHVIDNYNSVKVTNNKLLSYDATVLGYDETTDLAVLRISKEGVLLVAQLGESSSISKGDTVFAVGSPQGLTYINSVTRGIISGSNRAVSATINNKEYLMDVIQTDTAINPGNSGGPLCSSNGKVIGINSMKLVESKIEGMGFAIPIEIALSYVDRLEKGEIISRPYLGIETLDLNTYINNRFYFQREYNFNLDSSLEDGVIVVSVENGSVASKAGLKSGDVIVQIDGIKTENSTRFRYLLYKYDIGNTITVKFYRGSEEKQIKITLSDIRKD